MIKYLPILLILLSCEKETEIVIGKKVYPIEGVYEGVITMSCDSFSYNVNKQTTIMITTFNGEAIAIDNHYGTAKGYYQGTRYQSTMEFVDVSDCGKNVALSVQTSGHLEGDSLIENGSFILMHNNKPYTGKCKTRSKRSSE